MVKIDFLGGSEAYSMSYKGDVYVRTEDTDCGVLWYYDGDQGIPDYVIEGDLEFELEDAFNEKISKEEKLNLVKVLKSELGKEILNDVMNLGMTLRQNQLNGYSSKSGNEVLKEYLDGKTKEIKEKIK